MELTRYNNKFLKSYLISFFFFKNKSNIIFIKKFKIFINFKKKIINFFFFFFFFLIFNKFFFYNNKEIYVYYTKKLNLLFYFLQLLTIVFLPVYNRSYSIKFNLTNSDDSQNLNLSLNKITSFFINNFFHKLNFFFIKKINFLFFFNISDFSLKSFYLRLLNIPFKIKVINKFIFKNCF